MSDVETRGASKGPKKGIVLFYCEGLSSYLVLGPLLDQHSDMISAVVRLPIIPKSIKTNKTPEKLAKNLNKSALLFKLYNVFVLYFYAAIAYFGAGRLIKKCRDNNVRHMDFSMLDDAACAEIEKLNPDYIFNDSAIILTKKILALANRGVINFHAAPLPQYRGAGNYFWLLNDGHTSTKGTLHFVDAGLDTGPVIDFTKPVAIAPDMSVMSFWVRMRLASHPLIEKLAQNIRNGDSIASTPQSEELAVVRTFPTAQTLRSVRAKGHPVVRLQDCWQLVKIAITGKIPQQ